ncbi:MAG: hypothetical protein AB1465_07215, partial [Patescibacteria group bacterium]
MKHTKVLTCLFVVLLGCGPSQEKNELVNISQKALNSDPAEALSCGIMTIQGNLGLGCLVEQFLFRLRHSIGKLINCPCFPFDTKIYHANIDVKKFNKDKPDSKEEANDWIVKKKPGIKSVINIHLGFYEDVKGKQCYVLWITSGYLKICKNNPGKTCLCINSCFPKLEELKEAVKQGWNEFSKNKKVQKAVIAVGLIGWLIDKSLDVYKCWKFGKCEFGSSLGLSPSEEDFNDDSDEPDQPELDEGPPPLNGCECNVPENDGNIC